MPYYQPQKQQHREIRRKQRRPQSPRCMPTKCTSFSVIVILVQCLVVLLIMAICILNHLLLMRYQHHHGGTNTNSHRKHGNTTDSITLQSTISSLETSFEAALKHFQQAPEHDDAYHSNQHDASRSSRHKKKSISAEQQNGTIYSCKATADETTVPCTVAAVGDAVFHARQCGMVQRMKHLHRTQRQIVATSSCLDDSRKVIPKQIMQNDEQIGRLPHAILIGVQKGGTTALYSYLKQHPRIQNSQKELYFLDEYIDRWLLTMKRDNILSNDNPQHDSSNTTCPNCSNSTMTADNIFGMHRTQIQESYSAVLQKAIANDQIQQQNQLQLQLRRDKFNNNDNDNANNIISSDTIHPNKATQYPPLIVEPGRQHHDTRRILLSSSNDDNTPKQLLLDLTPNYIVQSDRIAQRIMCITPRAKIFTLLRDPIERARSSYDMKRRFHSAGKTTNKYGQPLPTFEEYVRNDIAALKETGVIQDWNAVDFDQYFGSPQEMEAWSTYIHQGLNSPVGWSLYAIQINHILSVLDEYGKPRSEFMAIPSNDLRLHTDATFGMVQDFLGLVPRISLENYSLAVNAASSGHGSNLNPELKQELMELFEPYNRKLMELLGESASSSASWTGETWEDFTIF